MSHKTCRSSIWQLPAGSTQNQAFHCDWPVTNLSPFWRYDVIELGREINEQWKQRPQCGNTVWGGSRFWTFLKCPKWTLGLVVINRVHAYQATLFTRMGGFLKYLFYFYVGAYFFKNQNLLQKKGLGIFYVSIYG